METEMEMVSAESIGIGEDLTPPLSPISYSLHDAFLHSHCSSCFSPLPSSSPHPNPNPNPNPNHHHGGSLLYCSSSCCESSHSPLHHFPSSAHLLSPSLEASDLRVALHFLLQIKPHFNSSYHRICGLMSNRHNLLTSTNDLAIRIRNGARAMAAAAAAADGEFLLEEAEAVLCAVLTNAVEVQDRMGRSVGIAVYDTCFSWINHSCSPNASYTFLPPETSRGGQRCCLITPASFDDTPSHLLTGLAGGPKIVVRSIKTIKKGEQVTVSYTDLLQPKELRQSELWSKYRFTCCCHRCAAHPLTYVDQHLQDSCRSDDFVTEYIDDAIDDYLCSNDTESCCKKLEDALLNHKTRLHPQNHLSLKAYTSLASAYSSASAIAIAMEDEDGLKMKRFSAAYSLLLALQTHDLFLHESSLIASVSNFWIGAGESLINLAARLVSSRKWGGWSIDIREANLEVLKEHVLKCIIGGGKVWKFLVGGNCYLEVVPMDVRWVESKTVGDDECVDGQQVFGLGAHCLLYGWILANISGGHDSPLSCYVGRLLDEL
ncbi:putative [histone H3]-lysine(4) N-trimethyltransferase chromatin remodeling SET family [Helianthus annuus]|nr:putative [histone H3]-lysine(4) N-trimethyltransferase chromatin remodeling SET family [Helianthus annuus]